MSGPVTSVARVEDVQIFLKDPVFYVTKLCQNTNLYIFTNQTIFFFKFSQQNILRKSTTYKKKKLPKESMIAVNLLEFSVKIGFAYEKIKARLTV